MNESNKIIAEFLGWEWSEVYSFESSWDQLIPVIKKCIDLEIYSSDFTNALHDGLLFVNIDMCYYAILGFIMEYNENKNV